MRYHVIPIRLAAIQSLTHTLAEAGGKEALTLLVGCKMDHLFGRAIW